MDYRPGLRLAPLMRRVENSPGAKDSIIDPASDCHAPLNVLSVGSWTFIIAIIISRWSMIIVAMIIIMMLKYQNTTHLLPRERIIILFQPLSSTAIHFHALLSNLIHHYPLMMLIPEHNTSPAQGENSKILFSFQLEHQQGNCWHLKVFKHLKKIHNLIQFNLVLR